MRIFVYRPQADAERTARAIAARGHEAVAAPLFQVVQLPEPAPEGAFSAIVLTSGNAVPALAQAPQARADAPQGWRDLPVFTVGARTASLVREAGFHDARSADGDRNDLIELIGRNLPAGSRLLLVAGQDRHEDVPQRLTEAGYDVVIWTAYAAEALGILPKEAAIALSEGGIDAVLHYSLRGAQTFIALTRAVHLGDEALGLTHVAISADVAAPLIAAGASTVLVAEHPEEAALLAALDQVSVRNLLNSDAPNDATASPDAASSQDATSEQDASPTPRSRSRRTAPTIQLSKRDIAETTAPDPSTAPETVLPSEALQHETPPYAGPTVHDAADRRDDPPSGSAPPVGPGPDERQRSRLPALALAGLVGGIFGAGLVLLASSRMTPPVDAAQVAELRSRIDALQSASTALDRKATSATEAAAKAGTEAQSNATRLTELAGAQRAQAPDAGAIAGLSAQAQRAEAAATAIGQRLDQRLDQTSARIGSVETLAKTAASPSPQALAAARIVLAERIQSAIASGQPFASDVAALAKGGGALAELAALNTVAATGAPTREALQAQMRGHRAQFDRETTPAAANWRDRLMGLAGRIVTIRSVGDTGADDSGTLVTRLENAIGLGRMGVAAGLWAQLPEPARQASADFGAALQKRAAADAAIAKIAQDAVAALGAAG